MQSHSSANSAEQTAVSGMAMDELVISAPRAEYVRASGAYQKEQLMSLSPVEVIRKLYDVAIQAAKKRNDPLAQKALNELIVGLNFDYGDIPVGLFRLYRYCKDQVRAGKRNEAIMVLEELRSTWIQAFNLDAK